MANNCSVLQDERIKQPHPMNISQTPDIQKLISINWNVNCTPCQDLSTNDDAMIELTLPCASRTSACRSANSLHARISNSSSLAAQE